MGHREKCRAHLETPKNLTRSRVILNAPAILSEPPKQLLSALRGSLSKMVGSFRISQLKLRQSDLSLFKSRPNSILSLSKSRNPDPNSAIKIHEIDRCNQEVSILKHN